MNGIDMSIIKSKKARFISSEEALKDVKLIEWDKVVLDGQEKIVATKVDERTLTIVI